MILHRIFAIISWWSNISWYMSKHGPFMSKQAYTYAYSSACLFMVSCVLSKNNWRNKITRDAFFIYCPLCIIKIFFGRYSTILQEIFWAKSGRTFAQAFCLHSWRINLCFICITSLLTFFHVAFFVTLYRIC